MNNDMVMGIINNGVLLLGLGYIYSVIPIERSGNKITRLIAIGFLLSITIFLLMLNPFNVAEGVVLDTRSILISVSAFFFGFIPTVMIVLTASLIRIHDGGAGFITGVLVIISSGIIGLLFRKYRYNKIIGKKMRRLVEFYIFSIIVHIVMLIMFLVLPEDIRFELLRKILPSVLLIYPIVTVIYASLMFFRYDKVTEINLSQENLKNSEKVLQQTLETLNHSRHLMKYTIDHSKSGISVHDINLNILFVSESYLEQFKVKKEDIIGKNPFDIFPFFPEKWIDLNKRTLLGEVLSEDKDVYTDEFGVKQWTRWETRPWFEEDSTIGGMIVYTENITKEVELLESLKNSEKSLKQAQEIGKIGSWELTLNNNKIWASKEAFNIYGIERKTGYLNLDEVQKMIVLDEEDEIKEPLKNLRMYGKFYDITFRLNSADGKIKYINSKASLVRDDDGNSQKIIGVIQDVTVLKQKEIALEYAANNDYLTGIYNRRYFEENLLKLDIEENYPLTIIMADINGLKLINDAFGHEFGDELLISATHIMVDFCKENDLLARIGGDEFVIVLPNTNESDAEELIRKINKNAGKINIESIPLSISFGYKSKNKKEEDIQDVFRSAEDAMYRQKLIEIPSMRSGAIETILTTLYEKDKKSEIHSRSVSNLSGRLAKAHGLDSQVIFEVKTAGLLHDIGKIIISETILKKEGELTTEEYELMKTHSEIGFRILNSTTDMRKISDIVLNHHERWDGKGYPRGIKANKIPLESRIISIADAFDAMTSERTYRDIISKEEALKEIIDNSGTQFDPELVEVFRLNFDDITIDL